jgi:hypothetical protein
VWRSGPTNLVGWIASGYQLQKHAGYTALAAWTSTSCSNPHPTRQPRLLRVIQRSSQRDQSMKNSLFTIAPVESSDCEDNPAEWGDHQTIHRIFSIKRGLLYKLDSLGLVKSVSLRRPGQKFSKRLWHLQSIRDYLNSLMQAQAKDSA